MNKIIPLLLLILYLNSCSNQETNKDKNDKLDALQAQIDSLKNLKLPNVANNQIASFLTYQDNNAEEAMNFYISLFENSRIIDIQRYGKDGPGIEGTIMVATFELNGSKFMCSDSYIKHDWMFTPGISNWVDCKTEEDIKNLYAKLSENGKTLMPLDNYGWSSKFAFIEDRFGVSWQLNLK